MNNEVLKNYEKFDIDRKVPKLAIKAQNKCDNRLG